MFFFQLLSYSDFYILWIVIYQLCFELHPWQYSSPQIVLWYLGDLFVFIFYAEDLVVLHVVLIEAATFVFFIKHVHEITKIILFSRELSLA